MELTATMEGALDQLFRWKPINVPELDSPVLIVLDYSPRTDQKPLSIAFDFSCGPKCWLSVSKVHEIGGEGPNPHPDYKKFVFEERTFHPYSITAFPRTIFEEIKEFRAACQSLYQHADWSE